MGDTVAATSYYERFAGGRALDVGAEIGSQIVGADRKS